MTKFTSLLRRRATVGLGKILSIRARKTLRYYYAAALNTIGRDYFPAHNDLDRKIIKYLGTKKGGVYIEAGANDGLSQSNTWHLEKRLGWTGLLIEPVPEIANMCRQFRSKSIVENCALGSFAQAGGEITLHYGALMTVAEGADSAHMHGGDAASHAREGAAWTGARSYSFKSKVQSLSGLLEKHGIGAVDLLSLDVEGFELNVLQGLDFEQNPIDFILIETSNVRGVQEILGERYSLLDKLSEHDYLFRSQN